MDDAGQQRWRQSTVVLVRNLLDGVLLSTSSSAEPVALNVSAALIWETWQEPASVAEVVEILLAQLSEPEESLRRQVHETADGLIGAGLLEPDHL